MGEVWKSLPGRGEFSPNLVPGTFSIVDASSEFRGFISP